MSVSDLHCIGHSNVLMYFSYKGILFQRTITTSSTSNSKSIRSYFADVQENIAGEKHRIPYFTTFHQNIILFLNIKTNSQLMAHGDVALPKATT